jgi:hypothetical protein
MPARKILVIRHAERPTEADASSKAVDGVTKAGERDAESLIVRGWQRAGALARLFLPVAGMPVRLGLDIPNVLFAPAIAKHSPSRRSQQTLSVLRELSAGAAEVNYAYPKNDVQAMTTAALGSDGIALICWEHHLIPTIGSQIMGDEATCPQIWPDDRFDMIWAFSRDPGSERWLFDQMPQLLLSGDSATSISSRA